MTRKFTYVSPNASLYDTSKSMVKNRVGSIILKEGDDLKGIITEKDIIEAIERMRKILEQLNKAKTASIEFSISTHSKRIEICQKAKKEGADELDVVISIPDVKHERWDRTLKDLKEICQILPTKVIIGSGYLTDEEILKASELSKKAGAICVKTATEKDPLDSWELKEKARHLKLMRKGAPGLLIKASGKVKTLADLELMVASGADIIGTSFGPQIMNNKN